MSEPPSDELRRELLEVFPLGTTFDDAMKKLRQHDDEWTIQQTRNVPCWPKDDGMIIDVILDSAGFSIFLTITKIRLCFGKEKILTELILTRYGPNSL